MRDARLLYEKAGKWSLDPSTFIELVSTRRFANEEAAEVALPVNEHNVAFPCSCENLKQIFAAYQQFSGTDIEQSIQIMDITDVSRTMMATGESQVSSACFQCRVVGCSSTRSSSNALLCLRTAQSSQSKIYDSNLCFSPRALVRVRTRTKITSIA